jgi:tRNA dimethylallyltransferase
VKPILSKIVVICGPTAVGKTGFAIELARCFSAEIIGADSMQIYRLMNIGTAKPTPEEQTSVLHHLVDIIDPGQDFDAAAFAKQADKAILELEARGILPLVVGGTGLYIKALLYGLFDSQPVDPEVRLRLQALADQEEAAALHRRLALKDPQAAARIHHNDTYRLIRALEIIETSGSPLSDLHAEHGFNQPRYTALQIGLTLPREALYQRINQRVDQMLAAGLEKEVRHLLSQGYDSGLKSMQSLGYRHMIDFIQGRVDWKETVRLLKRDHRRYAKRQMTWFRADADIHWLAPGDHAQAQKMIRSFLNH